VRRQDRAGGGDPLTGSEVSRDRRSETATGVGDGAGSRGCREGIAGWAVGGLQAGEAAGGGGEKTRRPGVEHRSGLG
jgi:hypothetical protein